MDIDGGPRQLRKDGRMGWVGSVDSWSLVRNLSVAVEEAARLAAVTKKGTRDNSQTFSHRH